MNDELYRALLVNLMVMDNVKHSNIHDIIAKHCNEESKKRGFDGWVDAYHVMALPSLNRPGIKNYLNMR